MIGAIGLDFPGLGVGPAPFSAEHPAPIGHPFTGMISEPPSPPSMVEWAWMAAPPIGTVDVLALAFGPPLAAALVLGAHTVVVGGGSWRR